jgi:DNA topoisomerase-6 subunit B
MLYHKDDYFKSYDFYKRVFNEMSEDLDSKQVSAEDLAKKQREISIAEFFEKNRHLLGFDNKKKALLTTIKEAVDNSLDACEEARILPELQVEIIDMGNDRYRVIVEDNGPGIVKDNIPKVFAKLLYGSKFHAMKQSRGQQGIGISASVMYGQLTTGRAARIISKTNSKKPAYYYELKIDTMKNKPHIQREEVRNDWMKDHGTRIELDLEASYQGGLQSVDEYIKNTAIVNPHSTIIYTNPKSEQMIFPRATEKLPKEAKSIKPHPYGVELGTLIKMLMSTNEKSLQAFLCNDFSRVGANTAKQICEGAALPPKTKPRNMSRQQSEDLYNSINKTKIMAPPTDCVVPIGSDLIEKGVKKEIKAEFYCSTTRPPNVYRGNPFIIEAAIAYGGEIPKENSVQILRFANRVPLLYQKGACATTKSVSSINWRPYGLSQSSGSVPVGPVIILVHIASIWTPYTSEAKEAIAHYDEILKEMRLALQECGRKLSSYVAKKKKVNSELKKRSYIEKYIPHVGEALNEILGFGAQEEENVGDILKNILDDTRIMPTLKERDVGPSISAYDNDDDDSAKKKKKQSFDDDNYLNPPNSDDDFEDDYNDSDSDDSGDYSDSDDSTDYGDSNDDDSDDDFGERKSSKMNSMNSKSVEKSLDSFSDMIEENNPDDLIEEPSDFNNSSLNVDNSMQNPKKEIPKGGFSNLNAYLDN